ncbi:glycosyltransferase family 2 protein [Rhodoferax sp. WC2427]|uniref:glycosyltransferase family 2 protein n=1 Tax=Rhodoferax sp. WC2427 TaxID=3234144 RepID=UPI0034664C7C
MTATADLQRPLRLSVIIPNFNYAEFLGQAIDSALAIDWPHIQVIVVDDGSTDGSRDLIARYAGRITAILQANAGQFEAYNAGYKLADGDVVIFLDSDDLLDREVMREIAAVWRAGISKVQFRLRTVDGAAQPLGNTIPQFQGTPTPEDIRHWATLTTTYPTPPGSGNAYAPAYLDKIFPLDEACGRPGDSICIAAAPFLGDVVTIPTALGCYRVHGRNDGAASKLDAKQFHLHVVRARQRQTYTLHLAKRAGIEIQDDAINNSLHYLPYRLASLRIAHQTHPIPKDNVGAVWRDVMRAMSKPQGISVKGRTTIAVWTTLIALLPQAAGMKLILWRFVPAARPQFLRSTLLKFGIIK